MKDYMEAKDVEELAKQIIAGSKLLQDEHIGEPKVYYLFKNKNSCNMGKCSLATGKWKYLTACDYVIEINRKSWDELDENGRKALVMHELLHIYKDVKVDEDGEETVKWRIRKHDVEEFNEVVKQYGAWEESIKILMDILKK